MKKIIKGLIFSVIMGIMVLSSSVVFAADATTWNPADKGTNVTLSNNNLTAVVSGSNPNGSVIATNFKTTGKWYWEVNIDSNVGYQALMIGIANELFDVSKDSSSSPNMLGYYGFSGPGVYSNPMYNAIYPNKTTYGTTYLSGDVISIALDIDNKNIKFAKNGEWYADIALPIWNKYYPMLTNGASGSGDSTTATTNFGGTLFKFQPPIGFSSISNLVSITGISLDKSADNLQVGRTDTLIATITPVTATTQNVTWTSSDVTIAKVDNTGKVTGVKAGSATITATTADGSNLSANCAVTVTDTTSTSGNRGTLTIDMNNGMIKQYDLSASELSNFLTWYDSKSKGTAISYYVFNIPTTGPYITKKDYISFDKIDDFEVQEYNSIK